MEEDSWGGGTRRRRSRSRILRREAMHSTHGSTGIQSLCSQGGVNARTCSWVALLSESLRSVSWANGTSNRAFLARRWASRITSRRNSSESYTFPLVFVIVNEDIVEKRATFVGVSHRNDSSSVTTCEDVRVIAPIANKVHHIFVKVPGNRVRATKTSEQDVEQKERATPYLE